MCPCTSFPCSHLHLTHHPGCQLWSYDIRLPTMVLWHKIANNGLIDIRLLFIITSIVLASFSQFPSTSTLNTDRQPLTILPHNDTAAKLCALLPHFPAFPHVQINNSQISNDCSWFSLGWVLDCQLCLSLPRIAPIRQQTCRVIHYNIHRVHMVSSVTMIFVRTLLPDHVSQLARVTEPHAPTPCRA